MRLKTLMHKLEQEYGTSFKSPHDLDVYCFQVDDRLVVYLEEADHDSFYIYTTVKQLDASISKKTIEELLSLNYLGVGTEGAVWAIDKETQSIVLFQRLYCFHLTYQNFLDHVTHFANVAVNFKNHFDLYEGDERKEVPVKGVHGLIKI